MKAVCGGGAAYMHPSARLTSDTRDGGVRHYCISTCVHTIEGYASEPMELRFVSTFRCIRDGTTNTYLVHALRVEHHGLRLANWWRALQDSHPRAATGFRGVRRD